MENGDGEYAQDGSVDLRGNPVLRSKRGGWTACTFIVGTFAGRPARARLKIQVCTHIYILLIDSPFHISVARAGRRPASC
jgi:hypothetical protein